LSNFLVSLAQRGAGRLGEATPRPPFQPELPVGPGLREEIVEVPAAPLRGEAAVVARPQPEVERRRERTDTALPVPVGVAVPEPAKPEPRRSEAPAVAPARGEPAGTSDAALDGRWMMAGGLPELAGRGLVTKDVGGQAILFLRAAGRLYGYRPLCPACERSLQSAALEGGEIRCSGCGSRYDALRAGRCLDSPQLHLEPVPLLVSDDGLVKVALTVAA